MTVLTVGSASAGPGEFASGYIDVPDADDPGCQIRGTVIWGARPGPVLAITAGIHGSEPSPIIALQRVRSEVDPGELAGSLVLVHVANVPSYFNRTIYRGPWDLKNLNRVFPGRADGTTSERIAHAITTHVIDQCDCLVDLHSGDGNEDLRPYSYWNRLGANPQIDAVARQLALAFGLDHIVVDRNRPRDRDASVFCANTAHVRGKPAITTEAGGVGVPTEEMVELNVRGVFRVMRYLTMLPGVREQVQHPKWIEPSVVLTSPDTGTWYPAVRPDQHVEKGALIGRLTDLFGDTITDVVSPLKGVVLYVVVSPAMSQGEPVAMVGSISPTPA